MSSINLNGQSGLMCRVQVDRRNAAQNAFVPGKISSHLQVVKYRSCESFLRCFSINEKPIVFDRDSIDIGIASLIKVKLPRSDENMPPSVRSDEQSQGDDTLFRRNAEQKRLNVYRFQPGANPRPGQKKACH